jgi:hypothetical protein
MQGCETITSDNYNEKWHGGEMIYSRDITMREDITPPGADEFPKDKAEFTTEEAAKYIGRSVATIRNHIKAGNIRPSGTYGGLLNNRYFLFDRESLDELYIKHCYHGKDED